MDELKKVVKPPVSLVTARLSIRGDRNQFLRFQPSGDYMANPYFVRPPFIFRVNGKVHDGEGEEADGTAISFMFSQAIIE